MITIYEHNGKELFKDEEGAYEIEDIRVHYAQFDKSLVTATYTVIPPEKEGEPRKVVFAKKTGTKGSGDWPAWISVEERLPELEKAVLCCAQLDDNQIMCLAARHYKDGDSGDWSWFGDCDEFESAQITYWLPLPPWPPIVDYPIPDGDGYVVREFKYNGFSGLILPDYAPYRARFVEWTTDPGIGRFDCSDGKQRVIPTFAIVAFDYNAHPVQPKTGILFGQAAHS